MSKDRGRKEVKKPKQPKTKRTSQMPAMKKKLLLESEAGIEIIKSLEAMVESSVYNTDSTYSANGDKYPDNKIPFVDKHLNYLLTHPSINPSHYLANLRLMTRIR